MGTTIFPIIKHETEFFLKVELFTSPSLRDSNNGILAVEKKEMTLMSWVARPAISLTLNDCHFEIPHQDSEMTIVNFLQGINLYSDKGDMLVQNQPPEC